MKPVVWFSEPALKSVGDKTVAGSISKGVAGVSVASASEFVSAMYDPSTLGFVDQSSLAELSKLERVPAAVIAVSTQPLPATISWLDSYPWLAHVASASMLEHPLAQVHFHNVHSTLEAARPRLLDWLDDEVEGRRVRMVHSERRIERLERMRAYLTDKGISARTIEQLADSAEELLTNAFYDAPVAAGVVAGPISRETPVTLPDSSACDLAYGAQGDLAIVRIKDPFGSLTRKRLVQVLMRCARSDGQVQVDETMGGAGLGLWRIFTNATFVGVVVVKGSKTEILVGIAKRSNPKPFAFDLFFADGEQARRGTSANADRVARIQQ